MTANRTTAIVVGVLYIIGTAAGILSLVFAGAILESPAPFHEAAAQVANNENRVVTGALCVLTMGFALAMIPAMMHPVLKKQDESLALGYVIFRGGLEAMSYVAIAVSWLLLIPSSQNYTSSEMGDAASLHMVGTLLLEAGDWLSYTLTFVFIMGALIFYSLLYRSKLVPRWLSGWGLIAAIPYLAAVFLTLFGIISPQSTISNIMFVPLAVQEMALAVWLIVKGFSPSASPAGPAPVEMNSGQLGIAETK
jgi:hypothetical protein